MRFAGPFGHCRHPGTCRCTDAYARGECPHWITEQHTNRFPATRTPAWQVVYWNGDKASGATGATRAVVSTWTKHSGWMEVGTFALPQCHRDLEQWMTALDDVHAAGMSARSLELSALLNDHGRG